ncbi:MAG: Rho termination factor N-terminal domain-containing protein, partial [Erysipelotrichaceae bacterium]|nr:Rho termination factor N-terminal domain-containing protein [Erysipelotrichaceae bacterium]
MTNESLDSLSLADLRELAKEKDIKGISKLKKSELIALLSETPSPQPEKKQEQMTTGILE